jgi:2-dehydropantoate 2-reductase
VRVRILVVGAGATGGFFGARLAQAGRDVTFLVRPRRAAALRERGLRIVAPDGSIEVIAPRLVTAPELAEPRDLILLSVKATALDQAMTDLAGAVGPRTVIVPFLNGMAHLDILNDRFGREKVLGGVVKVMTDLDSTGDILRLGPLSSLTFGEQDGGLSDRVREIAPVFEAAGFDSGPSTEIIAAMWHKWVFIATLGATTCLLRGSTGEVVAVQSGAEAIRDLLAEVAGIAAAAGFPLLDHELMATANMVTQSAPITASMYRDVLAGRPTEVEHVFGDLLARARAWGVDTPRLELATVNLRVHQNRVAGASS